MSPTWHPMTFRRRPRAASSSERSRARSRRSPGSAIYRARGWQRAAGAPARPRRPGRGGGGDGRRSIASPAAAVGPGTGAAVVGRDDGRRRPTLLAVALLRAAATTAAVAAGGCGGLFVPFLAIGDVAGRALAPTFGVPSDLAGAAGAAGGIAGGYRLPFTAVALVLGLGRPQSATLRASRPSASRRSRGSARDGPRSVERRARWGRRTCLTQPDGSRAGRTRS